MGHGGKPTRCDVALDDYRRIVSPGEVHETLQGPDVVTHAQKVLTQQGGVVGSRDLTGATVYLGAPGSRQRIRVYDKGLESGGEMDCVSGNWSPVKRLLRLWWWPWLTRIGGK